MKLETAGEYIPLHGEDPHLDGRWHKQTSPQLATFFPLKRNVGGSLLFQEDTLQAKLVDTSADVLPPACVVQDQERSCPANT